MSNTPFIGRRDAIGVGVETTAGTAVAPASFQKQLTLTLDQKTTVAKETSALYRVENQNNSAVTEEWAQGSIEGNVSDYTHGYFLNNIFGTCTATLHSGESTVYDNTFTVNQNQVGVPTLTFARVNPVASRRYAFGNLSDYELDAKTGGWVTFKSSVMANVSATASDTATYTQENLFTSKHVTVKYASSLSGLTGATAMPLKSTQLKITRKLDRFTPLGVIDPTAWDTGTWSMTGQIVLRYTDTTLETLALANTAQAMSITIDNTDVTIGATSHPTLTFTMPQVRFTPITLDTNLDQVLSQTISFTAELSQTSSYMAQGVLTNMKNGYTS